MNINRGDDRYLTYNKVIKEGRSFNKGKGNLMAVKFHTANKQGLEVISDFTNLPKDHKIAIQVAQDQAVTDARGVDNRPASTVDFTLKDVMGVEVSVPSKVQAVDDFIIGYDGLDEDSALFVEEGSHKNFEIVVSGGQTDLYSASKENVFPFTISRAEGETMQEAVQRAVQDIKDMRFQDYNNLTDLIKVSTVDSTKTTPGAEATKQNFWHLDLRDSEDGAIRIATDYNENLLGYIQGDYDFPIKQTEDGKFVMVLPDTEATVEDFVIPTANATQDCECPEGYEPNTPGELYSIKSINNGNDVETAIAGVSPIADSFQEVDSDGEYKMYMFLTEEEFDITEIDIPGIEVKHLGHTDQFCEKADAMTFTWVKGEECYITEEEYTIIVPHDRCGEKHLDVLQAEYGEGVEEVETANCATKYSLKVATNVLCEECSPILLGEFESEAPEAFGPYKWKKEAVEFDADALMGIRITGKEFNSNAPERYFGKMKFFNDSTRLSINTDVCDEYSYGEDLCDGSETKLTVLSLATTLENKGYDLMYFENESRNYFYGRDPKANKMEQYFTGTESLLEPNAQYIVHTLKVQKTINQGNNIAPKVENFNYKFPSKFGHHADIEELLNKLAAANGKTPVKAL